jgi:hypothetical protein
MTMDRTRTRIYAAPVARAIGAFLADLECELLAGAERYGPLRGRILPPQRPFSHGLDVVESARQELAGSVQLELFA